MYVCVCKVVTDKQIRQSVQSGVDSMRGLRINLGVASECGKCAKCALQLLREARCQPCYNGGAD